MQQYKLEQAGEVIGSVDVGREGLYLHFSCRCDLCGEVMYQLFLCTGAETLCLGLLVPMDGRFGLEKRIAAGKIQPGPMSFVIRPRHAAMEADFYPVSSEDPFAYLRRLEQSYLIRREQSWGVGFRNEK